MAKSVSWDEIKRFRTKSTVEMVKIALNNIKADDLISELFVKTNNLLALQLVKKFEKQLLLAVLNPNKFEEQLYDFFVENAKWIKEKKLYRQYFEFVTFMDMAFETKGVSKQVKSAYFDLLMEQSTHFSIQKYSYGINESGDLMVVDEMNPFVEFALYEFMKKNQPSNLNLFKKCYKKYGYDVNCLDDVIIMNNDEQMIANMLFQLTYFINEGTIDIFPYPYFLPSTGISRLVRQWESNKFYYELLKNKKITLPFSGVIAKFKNAGCINEILFLERIVNDRLVLLYKIQFTNQEYHQNNMTYSSGYIDLDNQFGYSVWRDTSDRRTSKSARMFHDRLENFVLETYTHLVCDFEIKNRKADAILVTSNLNNCMYFANQPIVQFVFKEGVNVETDIGTNGIRNFNKEDYLKYLTDIKPFVRKLPIGAKASEEAILEAKKMGYILREGETFVRPHKKTVYKNMV